MSSFAWLQEILPACAAAARSADVSFDWWPKPPADSADLDWLEESLQWETPRSLRDFLFHNDGVSFCLGLRWGESAGGHTIHVYGTRAIVADVLRNSGDPDRRDYVNLIDFEDGDMGGMYRPLPSRAIDATVYDLDHDAPPISWTGAPIGADLEAWLRRVLEGYARCRRRVSFDQDDPIIVP